MRWIVSLVCGAFLVSTIVPTLRYEQGLDGRNLPRLTRNDGGLSELQSELSSVRYFFVQPVAVGYIRHYEAEQFFIRNLFDLIKWETASRQHGNWEGKPVIAMLMGVVIICFGAWWGNKGHGFLGMVACIAGVVLIALGTAWFLLITENVSAAPGIDASATRYSRAKYVYVLPVVVTELKLGNVQRHVFGTDLVIGADHAALNQRPKTFNRVGVNSTDNVLVFAVVNHFVRKRSGQIDVTGPRVRSQEADLVGNGFPNELGYARAINTFQDASDDFALALDCADNADLAGAAAAPATAALIPVFVFVLPTDVGFVHFDDTAEFIGPMFAEASADAVAHVERGFIRAEAHDALNLQCADALLAGQHHVNDPEPIPERFIRVLEDRPDQHGEAIAARRSAFGALPVEGTISDGVHVHIAATGAVDAFRPATGYEVSLAGFLGREQDFKLLYRQLGNGFNAGHRGLLRSMEAI